MCNAKNHSAGCNCGFGPRSAGLNVTSGEYEKVTRDALAEVFPAPKMSADGKDFGNPLYNGLANDPGLSDADKAKAKEYLEKLGDPAIKAMSDALWGAFETVSKAAKGLTQNAFIGKLADAYMPVLTNALPLDVVYENKTFWTMLYGDKKRAEDTMSTIENYRKERGNDDYDVLISSPFGPRVYKGKKENHTGIDMNTIGVPGVISHAPTVGKVQTVTKTESGGNTVRMVVPADDGSACLVQTCHHNRTFVKEGDVLEGGQAVAEVSDKGKASGKHVDLKMGYAIKPPEASVRVAMKKGFKAADFGDAVSYKDGVLSVKGEGALKLKDKLAAQAEDKSAVEGLFTDYKPRKYTYDEVAKMTPAQFRKIIDWSSDIHYVDPYKGDMVKSFVPSMLSDMKRQIVAKKVAEVIAEHQKQFAKAKPAKKAASKAKKATGAQKARPSAGTAAAQPRAH